LKVPDEQLHEIQAEFSTIFSTCQFNSNVDNSLLFQYSILKATGIIHYDRVKYYNL